MIYNLFCPTAETWDGLSFLSFAGFLRVTFSRQRQSLGSNELTEATGKLNDHLKRARILTFILGFYALSCLCVLLFLSR